MSDPGVVDASIVDPNKAPLEQDGSIPDTVVIPDPPVDDPAPVDPVDPAPIAAAADPEKPKRTPWYQTRIDTLTRQKAEERAAREAAETRAKLLEQAATPVETAPKGYTQEDFQTAVRAEAQRVAAVEKASERTKSWFNAGTREFGTEAFNDKCNTVAAMGAGDNPDFMKIVTDPDIIPDGHKVVAALADNPEEAERILSLEPMKMAAALTRFATTVPAPVKPISQAPKPITQVGGSAKQSAPTENEPIEVWMVKRREQVANRGKAH